MSITADTPVVNVSARISRASFIAYLQQVNSPAASGAPGGYDVIVANHVDPLFALACFQHESGCATNPASVDVRYQTLNPGNTRSSRIGSGVVIQTDKGAFVRYPTWQAGWRDLAYRLVDPSYVYAQQHCTTPGTIIPKFAPKEDGNDPKGYLQSVLAFMNQHEESGGMSMAADDPKATWQASSNYTPGRGGDFIDHITCHGTYGAVGDNSLNWLRGKAGGTSNTDSSATYLISRAGEIWQMVKESDESWSDGNGLYNKSGISIEHEHATGQDWPDAQITASIGLQARIAQRQGWKSVHHPADAVLPEGGPAGTGSIIAHSQVPSETNPNQGGGNSGHTGCPGASFPFGRIVTGVNAALTGKPAPQPAKPDDSSRHYFEQTHFWVGGGFWQFWQHRGGLKVFGYPLSREYVGSDGLTTQWFERACFTWRKGADPKNWDVVLKRLGAEDLKADKAAHAGAFAPQPPPK